MHILLEASFDLLERLPHLLVQRVPLSDENKHVLHRLGGSFPHSRIAITHQTLRHEEDVMRR